MNNGTPAMFSSEQNHLPMQKRKCSIIEQKLSVNLTIKRFPVFSSESHHGLIAKGLFKFTDLGGNTMSLSEA